MSGVKCDNRHDQVEPQPPADTRDPWHHLASSSSRHRIKHERTPPILAAISGMREHEVCTKLRALIVVYDKWTKRNVFSSNNAGILKYYWAWGFKSLTSWAVRDRSRVPWPRDHPPHQGSSSFSSSRISFSGLLKTGVMTSDNWWLHHNSEPRLMTFSSLRTILCLTQLPCRSVSSYLRPFYAFDSWLLNWVEAVIILEKPWASWSFAVMRLCARVIRTPNWCWKYDFQKLFMILHISKSPNSQPCGL